jgi:hypothetical protein
LPELADKELLKPKKCIDVRTDELISDKMAAGADGFCRACIGPRGWSVARPLVSAPSARQANLPVFGQSRCADDVTGF